jgi:hypothetical protein
MTNLSHHERNLLSVLVRGFEALLWEGLHCDRFWRIFTSNISRHGLLDQNVWRHSSFKHAPLLWHSTIEVDRDLLLNPQYRRKIADILAAKWLAKLKVEEAAVEHKIALMHSTPEVLAAMLHALRRTEVNATTAAQFIMRRMADELVDQLLAETLIPKLDEIG